MPSRKDELEKRTFKGIETEKRIYYFLTSDKEQQILVNHKLARVLSEVVKRLVDSGGMTEEELDDLLLSSSM